MVDRSLARVFASFSTIILVACLLTIPLSLLHAFAFRDVLIVRDLAPAIETFPEGRQVRGVARGDLDAERRWAMVVMGLQALTIPLVIKASRRVIAVECSGGAPTVPDALRHLRSPVAPVGPAQVVAAGGAIGLAAAWFVWQIGMTIADLGPDRISWAVIGLARGTAAGTVAALVGGCAAAGAVGQPVPTSPAPKELDLY